MYIINNIYSVSIRVHAYIGYEKENYSIYVMCLNIFSLSLSPDYRPNKAVHGYSKVVTKIHIYARGRE